MSPARALLAVLFCAAMTSACAVLRGPVKPPAPPAAAPAVAAPGAIPPPPGEARIAPKPVKCVPDDVGPPPAYPDTDSALRNAGGAADRYQLLAAGRLLREQRLKRLEEVVKRCRNVAR